MHFYHTCRMPQCFKDLSIQTVPCLTFPSLTCLARGLSQVLRSLGFSIKPELPFVYLLNYLKALAATPNVAAAGISLFLCLWPLDSVPAYALHRRTLV